MIWKKLVDFKSQFNYAHKFLQIMDNNHSEIYKNVQFTQFELTYKLFLTNKFLENKSFITMHQNKSNSLLFIVFLHFKTHANGRNKSQHCCMLLANNVASVCMDLKF